MKRLILLLTAIMVCMVVVGCGYEIDYDTLFEETSTSEASEPTLLWKNIVTFDENNKIELFISEEDPNELHAIFHFDGENPSIEYTRLFSAIAVATEYGFGQNLFFVIISGENIGMVSLGGVYKWELPETYVTGDDSVREESFSIIRDALSELTPTSYK